jgi:hypothetical protein
VRSERARRAWNPCPNRALWRIGPPRRHLVVENADLVLAELPYFLCDWPIQWAGDDVGAIADIGVRREAGGFTVTGPGSVVETFHDSFAAANGLAGALISGLIARDKGLICAHAGAAEVGGRLVAVLGTSFAGKSSIAIQLAAAGHRLFGDDRLAIRLAEGRGVCLGLMPKIRLPIPDDAGPRFEEFVAAYTELEGDGVAYLKPLASEVAPFSEEAPLAAVVLLERIADAEVVLRPASPPEMVRALVENIYASHIGAQDLLSRLAAFAARVPGYRLRFSSSRAAAERLAALLTGRATADD